MWVRDHKADTVDCGAGDDTVFADKDDTLTGCEHAKVRGGNTASPASRRADPHPTHPPKPTRSEPRGEAAAPPSPGIVPACTDRAMLRAASGRCPGRLRGRR